MIRYYYSLYRERLKPSHNEALFNEEVYYENLVSKSVSQYQETTWMLESLNAPSYSKCGLFRSCCFIMNWPLEAKTNETTCKY